MDVSVRGIGPMTVGSAGTVSTAGAAAAPTAATARPDVADGWAAWPEPVPAKTGTASATAATMARRRRVDREANSFFTLSFFRESCATAGAHFGERAGSRSHKPLRLTGPGRRGQAP